ncbi:protein asteroid homolog 1 [Hyla sarda]|uniref:protein asteroid homolog 1 n=1 Tax=Hyla sarda TaxID=327740 RepID=UPI0024C20F55|nr:protein asteroid homolog 1 [Hyla sarda]XP_056376638.1 protein asteroid homolog 1 [Hyla sarda]XP_056376639.1 protein asteroid homolog 1 [Hyla sarda]XP_056376640.1 protein asteroid homolog 1 [Hyla sarda]XP_056376641.1 protein asteroid homolog 1 [Hyla sarda]XP_056376642.1 protein asteroid homolog 1 [Hyla sarda]XP_056376643.1 protein asteroid homolog 1 [Hyla sarda]
MGIQGFMTFVCSHSNFFHELKLKNTKLIIDGNNLYHKLYFDSGLDLVHGGDYDRFTDVLYKFFESLSVCNIQAYVVFDGGCDISDKKLETQKQRVREKIAMAHSLSVGRGGSVLPLLSREVCIQVLRKLQVPFVQCFSEADREIVVLANRWNCPILSFDSDFCIFDLKAGYCPLTSFQWKNIASMKETQECYLPARCFSAQKLCHIYNNMNVDLLPLFAVLMGNDYISLPALETFFSKVHLPGGNNHSGRRHKQIHGLLNWLSGFADVEEAMKNVLNYLRLKDRDSVRQLLCSAMEEYSLYETVNLEQYFVRGVYLSPTAVKLHLPEWVQFALARGELSPLLSDALVLRRVFLHVQVEDIKKPSAHSVTKPVRKLIYAILLNAKHEAQKTKKLCVGEFDRLETNLRRSTVGISCAFEDLYEDLSLSTLPQLPLETRLKLLLWSLDVKMSDLEFVQSSYKLILAIVCYWIRHADPKVKLHHVKALIMGIVCGEASDIHSKAVWDEIRKLRIESGQHKRLNLEDAHILCQWQCCVQIFMHFNQLLSSPLPEPDISRMYSGSFVHHMIKKLKESSSSEDLFQSCPPLEKLYRDCIHTVMSAIPLDCFQSRTEVPTTKPKKKRKVGKKGLNLKEGSMLENQPQCDFSSRFACLSMED